jgi:hypothetical protein
MSSPRNVLRQLVLVTSVVLFASQSASAVYIIIEFKHTPDGSWSLLGSTFNHYHTTVCVNVGVGDPPPHLGIGVVLPDSTPPGDLLLTDLRYYAGPGALAALGGDPVIFDDTMFPPPPGYLFDTMGGTEFNIHFETPIATLGGESMVDLTGVFVSSRLDIGDPNLILAEATLSNGTVFPVMLSVVPEPGTLAMAGTAIVAVSLAIRRRRR